MIRLAKAQCKLGKLLPERALRTFRHRTHQPADLQFNHQAPARHRKISQRPDMAGMHPARRTPASRTDSLRPRGLSPHPQNVAGVLDLVDDQRRRAREQESSKITKTPS